MTMIELTFHSFIHSFIQQLFFLHFWCILLPAHTFCLQCPYDFQKVKVDEPGSVCVCLCLSVCLSVCLSACLYIASHISETSEMIAIKFDKVTVSVMAMNCV